MILVLFFAVVVLAAPGTLATVPSGDNPVWGSGNPDYRPDTVTADEHLDYIAELQAICSFLDIWQVKDTEDPEFGGMIEDEYLTGEDRIVQSDNTQEAIYVWSRYYQLTGDNTYFANIQDAWTYLTANPAWLEESPYYRIWNCGWGLRCTMQYERVYEMTDQSEYGVNSANHIVDYASDLSFEANPPGVGIRNALTVAWAAWNLSEYARYSGDGTYAQKAASLAETVKTWVESDPGNITKTSWALSGGVAAACVLDVLFSEDQTGAADWEQTHLANLPAYYDPAEFNPSDWIHAWDSWQALAQNALWRTTGDFTHRRLAFEQSDFLRSFDTDGDGGIPPNPGMSADEDHTWVSTYIVLMGFAELEEAPAVQLTMTDTEIEAGDRMETLLDLYGPGLDQAVDLVILLEVAGTYYFWPNFTEDLFAIPLTVTLDFDLTEFIGSADSLPLLVIDPWPTGVPAMELTWWGATLSQGTTDLVGDVVNLTWSTR